MWGRPLNWSTARIWALAAGGADEPGVLWCGTLPGGLFRSTITGRAGRWCARCGIIPSASSGWAAAPTCRASIRSASTRAIRRRVWVAVSTGGIWLTEDAGASWALRGEGMRAEYCPPEQTHDPIAQDVHCLVQCPAAPERMWVQHHNGIFVSSDEGRTLHRDQRRRAVDVRLRRRRASARARHGVVRSRDQGREAHPARRASWSSRARATAARASSPDATACRSRTPTTSSTAMRLRSTRRATASPSARPPAASG